MMPSTPYDPQGYDYLLWNNNNVTIEKTSNEQSKIKNENKKKKRKQRVLTNFSYVFLW